MRATSSCMEGRSIFPSPRSITWRRSHGHGRAIAQPRIVNLDFYVQIAVVFLAYFVAGKLGQATSSVRSDYVGPVWPAYGVALASLIGFGYRVWPALLASAFVVARHGSVTPLTAFGQAAGATLAAAVGAWALKRIPNFDPELPRLRDALGLIVLGGFGSALVSSTIGITSLYVAGFQAYSGLPSGWLIYWLGDATGVLLVTPIVFTLPRLLRTVSRARMLELALLLGVLTLVCFAVFGDWPIFPMHTHVLAFVVLPFVMWGAINFGIAGAALSVTWTATIATVLTAFAVGPFSDETTFINATMLDVFFTALSLSGLSLAAVIAERERIVEEDQARQAFAEINRRLITAQEEERARIARELHDDIGQRLALLVCDLSETGARSGQDVTKLQADASQIASDVQALSHRLHSSKLELLGLAKTSRMFCEDFSSQQKVPVIFDEIGVPAGVSPAASLCLYRILQESLHNAAKHSGARGITVHLRGIGDAIELVVEDAGSGFDVEAAKASRGIGLVSMQERASLVGGTLSIFSAPGRGTRIEARVPVSSN
jgi:signal transduction histidine kinase